MRFGFNKNIYISNPKGLISIIRLILFSYKVVMTQVVSADFWLSVCVCVKCEDLINKRHLLFFLFSCVVFLK